ncbi:MAG: hypothetical protein AB1553_00530 [Nitrospirota bacterium]
MDLGLKEILQFVIQGGVAIVVFIIWYFTFTKSSKQTEAFLQQSLSQSAEAFDKNAKMNEQLLQFLKDEQDYKLQLAGILDRLSIKLDTPAQCPILMTGKKFTLEVKE